MTDDDATREQPTVPDGFIPDGTVYLTNYTADDLPALAEKIGERTDTADTDEILEMLRDLVEYKVPVAEADRSARIKYGGEGK